MNFRRISAGLDPASMRNACALAVLGETFDEIWVPLHLRQWIPTPGSPLDLRLRVLPEAAADMRALGAHRWATDPFASAEVLLASRDEGIGYAQATSNVKDHWRHLAAVLTRRRFALLPTGLARRAGPPWPDADALGDLRAQLGRVRREYVADGWSITIPEVGRLHGDLAVAVARALWLARAADPWVDTDAPRQRLADDSGLSMAEF